MEGAEERDRGGDGNSLTKMTSKTGAGEGGEFTWVGVNGGGELTWVGVNGADGRTSVGVKTGVGERERGLMGGVLASVVLRDPTGGVIEGGEAGTEQIGEEDDTERQVDFIGGGGGGVVVVVGVAGCKNKRLQKLRENANIQE